MMMPANYSVIAENEMTYVNGGALIDCFAPVMNFQLEDLQHQPDQDHRQQLHASS